MKKTTPAQSIDLTTAEIAERLEISPRAVLGLIKRGRFPNARKLPAKTGTYLTPLSDFESYLVVREARRKRRKTASSPQVD